jgi:hypothetical protein
MRSHVAPPVAVTTPVPTLALLAWIRIDPPDPAPPEPAPKSAGFAPLLPLLEILPVTLTLLAMM